MKISIGSFLILETYSNFNEEKKKCELTSVLKSHKLGSLIFGAKFMRITSENYVLGMINELKFYENFFFIIRGLEKSNFKAQD